MSAVGQREIQTQRRVVAFFQNALGYRYLGHWQDRPDNRNVEREHIADWLKRQGHGDKIIDKALFELNKAAALGGSKTLYDANREVYGLLRYGVKVRPDVGEQNVTVWLIDWKNPGNNDFAIAEEVTVRRREHQAARPRALHQRHRLGSAGIEALDSVGDRGHSPESRQPKEGIHPAVFLHRATRAGRQRHRGPALRRDRDGGEVLAALEGSRGPPGR